MVTKIVAQGAKSKTVNFNVFAPIILGILSLLGITIPTEIIVGGIALVNILLRYATKKPISAK